MDVDAEISTKPAYTFLTTLKVYKVYIETGSETTVLMG